MYQDNKSHNCCSHKAEAVPSDEITSSFIMKGGKVKNNIEPGTPYEVFRNNTTAVEVIVKEIGKPRKRTLVEDTGESRNIPGDVSTHKKDLTNADIISERKRKQYQAVIRELNKQLDNTNKREMDAQTKNIYLLLENEKLKGLLNSKTNLVDKLKKELSHMKCLIKFVIKTVCQPPQSVSLENATMCTTDPDPEYDEFENELQKEIKNKFAVNMFEAVCTFDSSGVSKEVKLS